MPNLFFDKTLETSYVADFKTSRTVNCWAAYVWYCLKTFVSLHNHGTIFCHRLLLLATPTIIYWVEHGQQLPSPPSPATMLVKSRTAHKKARGHFHCINRQMKINFPLTIFSPIIILYISWFNNLVFSTLLFFPAPTISSHSLEIFPHLFTGRPLCTVNPIKIYFLLLSFVINLNFNDIH